MWRWLQRIGFCSLLLSMAVSATFYIFCWCGKQAAEAEFARLHAAGEPVTLEELQAYYQLSHADRECTEAWTSRLAELQGVIEGDFENGNYIGLFTVESSYPTPGEARDELAKFEVTLKKCEPIFLRLREAADMPGEVRLGTEAELSPKDIIAHIISVRTAQRLLMDGVFTDLQHGRPQAATEKLALMMKVPQFFATEPSLTAYLVGRSLQSMARSMTAATVGWLAIDDSELARWQTYWLTNDDRASLQRSLRAERALFWQRSRHLASDLHYVKTEATAPASTRFLDDLLFMRRGYDHAYSIQAYDRLLQITHQPIEKAIAAAQQLREEIAANSQSPLGQLLYWQTATYLPPLAVIFPQERANYSKSQLLGVALAIERYRRAVGQLPAQLTNIVPKYLVTLPNDPWTNAPVRYRAGAGGFVVWWPGPDGVDDEARPIDPDRDYQEPDITVRIRLPK